MNKLEKNIVRSEKKERFLVPILGFCAVLASMVAFLILLYIITIVIRLLFVLGERVLL